LLADGSRIRQNRSAIPTAVYKKKTVEDNYNEICLSSKEGYQFVFRLYDDGCAYRWETFLQGELIIENEIAQFNLNDIETHYIQWVNTGDTVHTENQFFHSFENVYSKRSGMNWSSTRLAVLPLLAQTNDGVQVCIFDADVRDYPGMYLQKKSTNGIFDAVFAPCPAKTEQGGNERIQLLVTERENYIAKTSGSRSFPWRAFCITDEKGLLNNDLAYRLSAPAKALDFSWVKPGKVAWDWWHDWNISGVDFVGGVNNATYQYYIDFASANSLEYVILDAGWSVDLQADMMQVVPEIDLPMLCDYGRQKNVGIILWGGMLAMENDMEGICKHYSEMGVKGFKIDFLDRDDQWMVDYTWRLAETAAKYKLLIDYHGVFKPNGLQRTYPNVVNFEAVYGLEQMKWVSETTDMVTHDVILPFVRMVAGPMDYTPGAMRNASRQNYRSVFSEPMSQGTRCRQIAQYIVFDAPLAMLSDNPANYKKEQECTDFIAQIPTVWDETIALVGKVGEYAAIARKKDQVWYIGGLNNWDSRSLSLDLSFLPEGNYEIELFSDGVNAARAASDYKRTISLLNNLSLEIPMAPGGGFAGRITVQLNSLR
jgi:alpha-glucosidase